MQKIKILISLIILIICCLMTTGVQANSIPETKISVAYKYNTETNTVTVTMTSNNELINNKTTWKLSEDKKQFTYEFDKNTIYTSSVTDIYGRKIYIPLEVTQIDQTPAKVIPSYKYKSDTNTVVVTLTSDKRLINNKTTWKLSENEKVFTYEFDKNTTYTSSVTDIYGNKIYIPLKVTQIDESPAKVLPSYEYKADTNTVVVALTSDKRLINNKTTWKLSENEKVFSYEFDKNTTYTSSVTDIYGNKIYIPLKVTQIDESPAKISVNYEYKPATNTVVVTMTSNKKLINNKTTWKLSADQKSYTYEFKENTTYTSSVVDMFGNKVQVPLNVTQVDDKGPEINIKYNYNAEKTQCIVTVTSNEEMIQKTTPGWKLSEDKKTYTYVATTNQYIITDFNDKYRNPTRAYINIFLGATGIDVSHHNGEIDWEKVKNSGIQFAIIRLGYGQDIESQDDRMFEYNVSECERLGIPYGVYLYSYALNVEHAKSEADHVLRLIKGHNPEYGIWYDLEDDNYKLQNGMPSNETFVDIAETFCERIIANGYENVGIYANLDWLLNKINSPRLDKYDKWVAQWGDKCTYEKDYVMWQYTDSGKIDGIDGNVDMNRYYGK